MTADMPGWVPPVPGSHLVLGQVTNESQPAVARAGEQVYNRSVSTGIYFRPRPDTYAV